MARYLFYGSAHLRVSESDRRAARDRNVMTPPASPGLVAPAMTAGATLVAVCLEAQNGYRAMSAWMVTHWRSQKVLRLTEDPKCPPEPDAFVPPKGATASSSTV